jgi:hypothetical protein
MEQPPSPVYANIINIRMSEAELILDFGCIVPEGSINGPVEFTPTVRVIMAIQGIHNLAEMLTRAAAAYAQKSKSPSPAPMGAIWTTTEEAQTASQP